MSTMSHYKIRVVFGIDYWHRRYCFTCCWRNSRVGNPKPLLKGARLVPCNHYAPGTRFSLNIMQLPKLPENHTITP